MEFGNHTAEVLVEALPYIKKFYGTTIVIKYGGHAMVDKEMREKVISDIVLMRFVGMNPILVHGGGPDINYQLEKENYQSKFVDGLRYTDQETMDIVQMVLCGKVNKDLVATLTAAGGSAVGLCGLDGNMLQAQRRVVNGKEYGLVGDVIKVDPTVIHNAIANEYIPVISTVARGVDGESSYNINADTAAAQIAVALGAEKLILLTDTRGLLRDVHDESTLISEVRADEVPGLIAEGVIQGGMIPKVNCCVDAVANGVHRTHILDGRVRHSILIEVLSHAGIGTMIW